MYYIYLNNWEQWLTFIFVLLVPCFLLGMTFDRIIVRKLTPKKIFEIIKTKIKNRKEIMNRVEAQRITFKMTHNPKLFEEIKMVLERNIES